MRVALPLLTLVPGISGGSETYARELCRGLARVGDHEYEALVPTLAPEAADGLPTLVATGYRASTTTPGRLRAMAGAALRPGNLRTHVDEADVVHYPLTVPIPPAGRPTVLTLLDVQHLDLPQFFPRRRAAPSAARVRPGGAPGVARRRDQRVGEEPCRRAARARSRARARRPPRRRPRAVHARFRRPARAVRLLPRPAVAAQEPRAAVRGLHAPPRVPSGASARSHRGGPGAARAAGRRRGARRPPAHRTDRPLPARRGARLPEPLRGVRAAARRGDGMRLSRSLLERGLTARGRRRCGSAVPAR